MLDSASTSRAGFMLSMNGQTSEAGADRGGAAGQQLEEVALGDVGVAHRGERLADVRGGCSFSHALPRSILRTGAGPASHASVSPPV